MAEVAKILNPKKKVLLPDLNAGCSLASSCNSDDFRRFREKYHDHIAITYINCSAEVKALSDIVCTSSNAEKIIRQIPVDKKIIFAPDKFLGSYLQKKTEREMVLWPGTCVVHESFSERELINLMTYNKDAYVLAHPECPENLLKYAHFIGSTSRLLNYVKEKSGNKFIVLTEEGIIHQMKKISANSLFYTVKGLKGSSCELCAQCPYMRLNTLEKIYQCLVRGVPEVNVPHDISVMAKKSLDNMLTLS